MERLLTKMARTAWTAIALSWFGLAACSTAAGQPKQPAPVKGSVTLEGQSVTLTHAYARRHPDYAGSFQVLLTDRPVEADKLVDFNIARWPTVHQGIDFTVDSKDGCITSHTIFHKGFDGGQGPSIGSGPCLKGFSVAQDRIAGALTAENTKRKWLVQAEFQVPLQPAAAK